MLSRLSQRFRAFFRPAAPSRWRSSLPLRFRLTVESLDDRVVPAALTWTNAVGNNDFYTAGNWTVAGTVSTSEPMAGDDVTFDGTVSSANCNNLSVLAFRSGNGGEVGGDGGGGAEPTDPPGTTLAGLNSLRLINGYAGTVTILAPLQVRTFVLAAGSTGAIAQPYTPSGNDLSVLDTFTWTSGILNNTANDALVKILGNGTVTIPTNDTLTCGSSLYFGSTNPAQPTATTVSGAGTIDFSNGSPITIDAGGSVFVNAPANATAKFTGPEGSYTDGKAKIELKAQGTLTVTGPGNWFANNRKLVNNGGVLEIADGAYAAFGQIGVIGQPPQGIIPTDILQNSGLTVIHSGCTLTSAWGQMEVKGGDLEVEVDGGGANGSVGTIGCQFTFSSGNIRITRSYGTLKVLGDFYWLGGTFRPTVDCAMNGAGGDAIFVKGKMYVGGTATVVSLSVNYNPQTGLGANFSRGIIYAEKGVASPVPNQAPSLAIQNQAAPIYALDLFSNSVAQNDGGYNLVPGPGQN